MSEDAVDAGPVFHQVNMVVADLQASLAFYRMLGLQPRVTPDGIHAVADLPGSLILEWDTAYAATRWDSGSRGAVAGSTILGFSVPSRHAVDEVYAQLTAAGYHGRQRPYDAFWGSRYAIVDDPDGNGAGLMSPVSDEHRRWPPEEAPPPGAGR